MPSKKTRTMEMRITLPKPIAHLFCDLVNIVFNGSLERE